MSWILLHIALESIRVTRRFLFRSALAVLTMGLGVAAVMVSVNFAAGGRQKALQQIARMGVNALVVTPTPDRGKGVRARTGDIVHTLVPADYQEIRERVPEIADGSPLMAGQFRIKAGDLSKMAQIVGCDSSYPRLRQWKLREGTWFLPEDERRAARVAVIGSKVAEDLFGEDSAIRRQLSIDRTPFVVIGVVEERGQGLDAASEDDQVYIPLKTAMRRVLNVDYYTGMLFEVNRMEEMDEAALSVESLLRTRHHRLANLPDDFQVRNQKSLIETETASARQLGFYVRIIGVAGLVVSGLGILAISLLSVKGRTMEIGTRRAVGARRADVFAQILFETLLLCAIGCAGGLGLGWEGSHLANAKAGLPFAFDAEVAREALLLAAAMNLIFALMPAAKATCINPIHALRQG